MSDTPEPIVIDPLVPAQSGFGVVLTRVATRDGFLCHAGNRGPLRSILSRPSSPASLGARSGPGEDALPRAGPPQRNAQTVSRATVWTSRTDSRRSSSRLNCDKFWISTMVLITAVLSSYTCTSAPLRLIFDSAMTD